ncbi:MAG: DcrB-related protein [candidate division Zixibacteria bacterium]
MKNNIFTLELSDNWVDRTTFLYMGLEDGGMQHILNLSVEPEIGDADLYEYARERIDNAVTAMPDAAIIKEEDKTLPNGNAAYECVYKWISPDGKMVFQKLLFLIIEGTGYNFSANFSKKTLKTLRHEVDGIINSFQPVPHSDDE